ncbi:MAG: LysE family translocator [Candidatus Saccharibacteria bacterium]|nr:LysE family translocator [Candidatus Saccharibacteria bacterium]
MSLEAFGVATAIVLSLHVPTLLIPGADVALVSSFGLLTNRQRALWAALGVTVGSAIMVLLAVLFSESFSHLPTIAMQVIRWCGGAYLLLLAIMTLRPPEHTAARRLHAHPFTAGLLTEITNPKTILFFLAVFTLVSRHDSSLFIQLYAGGLIILLTGIYYVGLALLSSGQSLTRRLSRHHRPVRAAAAALFTIAAVLLVVA